MRFDRSICALFAMVCVPSLAVGQPPGDGPERQVTKQEDVRDLVSRMMAFDANKDGKLMRDEITDAWLVRLHDRADADRNGSVTKEELASLAEKEHSDAGGFGPPGFGPPGSGPRGGGPGGPPGFGGGPPWRPGQILPPFLIEGLNLSSEQRKQFEELQKDVDARLEKILTSDQRGMLRRIGPGGPGGMGLPGGRRRPSGGPPPGGGPPPR